MIRGIYSEYNNQTLVLYNGVPMTTMFIGNRGAMGWFAGAQRVAGGGHPGSGVRAGADAYAGVINIITKTAAELNGLEAGLRLSSLTAETPGCNTAANRAVPPGLGTCAWRQQKASAGPSVPTPRPG